ncbi:hypothetical protein LTR15_008053 [Elasticomyces elasticus]|nr:hypothetical protein LTR15_008053 [Elasticomyces elasticus]
MKAHDGSEKALKLLEQLKTRLGYVKIVNACAQARKDGFLYLWADTSCIDKTNNTELYEAIGSMYAWYQSSDICYACLSDVVGEADEDEARGNASSERVGHDEDDSDDDSSDSDDEESGDEGDQDDFNRRMQRIRQFRKSRWFTRGTLQELLAPRKLVFFCQDWAAFDGLVDPILTVHQITRIPIAVLQHQRMLSEYTIAQRLSWAADRNTERLEDQAYCLLGILDIHMQLQYTEGRNAFLRLQNLLLLKPGGLTILAWEDPSISKTSTLLAPYLSCFRNSGDVTLYSSGGSTYECLWSNLGLKGEFPVVVNPTTNGGNVLVSLQCVREGKPDEVLALRVRASPTGRYEYHVDMTETHSSAGTTCQRLGAISARDRAGRAKLTITLSKPVQPRLPSLPRSSGSTRHTGPVNEASSRARAVPIRYVREDQSDNEEPARSRPVAHTTYRGARTNRSDREEPARRPRADDSPYRDMRTSVIGFASAAVGTTVAYQANRMFSPGPGATAAGSQAGNTTNAGCVAQGTDGHSTSSDSGSGSPPSSRPPLLGALPRPTGPDVPLRVQATTFVHNGLTIVLAQDPLTKVTNRICFGPTNNITDPALLSEGIVARMALYGIADEAGETEQLFSKFRLREQDFFSASRVFSMLWVDAGMDESIVMRTISCNPSRPDQLYRNHDTRDKVYSYVQDFIVVRAGTAFCSVVPIVNYGGRGVGLSGIIKSRHSLVYTGKNDPAPLPCELPQRGGGAMMPVAIRVVLDHRDEQLVQVSRLDYSKVYTVYHTVKVAAFGVVHEDSQWAFLDQFNVVWTQLRANGDSGRRLQQTGGGPASARVLQSTQYAGDDAMRHMSQRTPTSTYGQPSRTGSSQPARAQTRVDPMPMNVAEISRVRQAVQYGVQRGQTQAEASNRVLQRYLAAGHPRERAIALLRAAGVQAVPDAPIGPGRGQHLNEEVEAESSEDYFE